MSKLLKQTEKSENRPISGEQTNLGHHMQKKKKMEYMNLNAHHNFCYHEVHLFVELFYIHLAFFSILLYIIDLINILSYNRK